MQYPKAKLDVSAISDPSETPYPQPVARPSGVVEILTPIARGAEPARPTDHRVSFTSSNKRDSWIQTSLIAVGMLAAIAIVLGTAIFFGSYDSPADPVETASVNKGETGDAGTDAKAEVDASTDLSADTSELVPDEDASPALHELAMPRSAGTRRHSARRASLGDHRHQVLVAANRPRRSLIPQFWVSDFVPTTLIVYVENGEIKTRIEQQLAAYKKPTPTSN